MGEGRKHTCVLAPTETDIPACTQGPHGQRHKNVHCPLCAFSMHLSITARERCMCAHPGTCPLHVPLTRRNVGTRKWGCICAFTQGSSSESGVGEMKMKRTQSLSPGVTFLGGPVLRKQTFLAMWQVLFTTCTEMHLSESSGNHLLFSLPGAIFIWGVGKGWSKASVLYLSSLSKALRGNPSCHTHLLPNLPSPHQTPAIASKLWKHWWHLLILANQIHSLETSWWWGRSPNNPLQKDYLYGAQRE